MVFGSEVLWVSARSWITAVNSSIAPMAPPCSAGSMTLPIRSSLNGMTRVISLPF